MFQLDKTSITLVLHVNSSRKKITLMMIIDYEKINQIKKNPYTIQINESSSIYQSFNLS